MHPLLLAYQACYIEMARAKGMKPETCAKLAAQCADYYRAASSALAPGVWDDIDKDFPWSLYTRCDIAPLCCLCLTPRMYLLVCLFVICRYWTACFDASAFFQFSIKTFADAEVGRGMHCCFWICYCCHRGRSDQVFL